MRRALALIAMLASVPAAAQELPQFPKAGPPEPLPEAICDTSLPNNGAWLVGRWVSPQSRWEFTRAADGLAWSLERKGAINQDFGWADGTRIDGKVDKVSGCTVTMSAGQGAFVFQGVLTDAGKLYGFATNAKGAHIRFVLRRER